GEGSPCGPPAVDFRRVAHDGNQRAAAPQRLEFISQIKAQGTVRRAFRHQGQTRPAKRKSPILPRNRRSRARHHRLAAVARGKISGRAARFLPLQNPAPHAASEKYLRLAAPGKDAFLRSSRGNEAQISTETIFCLEPPYVGCYFICSWLNRRGWIAAT